MKTVTKTEFSIEEIPFGATTELRLVNTKTNEFVSILPALGGTLNQVVLEKNGKLFELLDGSMSYTEYLESGITTFKGSKLFPFPNRIKHGKYTFEEKLYQLPINFPHEKNSIHGLVFDKEFILIEEVETNHYAEIKLRYTLDEQQKGYPFKLEITLQFILSKSGFKSTTYIRNLSLVSAPIGDGWHPYLKTGTTIDSLHLSLPVEHSYEVDENMIPTVEISDAAFLQSTFKINQLHFDTCFKTISSLENKAFTFIEDPIKNIKIVFWQETGVDKYNFLQVYTPPNRMSIAIEPMTCIANSFNNQIGLQHLAPGQLQNFSFGLYLE